jgi:hypothetical protein
MSRKIGDAAHEEDKALEDEYLALREEVLKFCDPVTLDRIILERLKDVYNNSVKKKIKDAG